MDPVQSLHELQLLANGEPEAREIDHLVEALADWIQRGGFEPDWDECPDGRDLFRSYRPDVTISNTRPTTT